MEKSLGLVFIALIVGYVSAGPDVPDSSSAASSSSSRIEAQQDFMDTRKVKREAKSMGNGSANTTLERAPDGHFYADVMVNGTTIHFIVDTGASSVALSRKDAQAAGLQFSDGEFTGRGSAASGEVAFKRVSLDRVALGPLEATNVDAVVLDGDVDISLLGQSWLRQIGTVTIEGDKMVLR